MLAEFSYVIYEIGRDEKFIQKCTQENLKVNSHLGNINWIVVLQGIIEIQGVRVWAGFIWLRVKFSGGLM
jgi:hypothetical protein